MVREVFSISKFLLKSEWLNRSGTNMWLSRKLDLRLVNFGAIDIKSWKYSDVLEEEEYWDFGLKKNVMSFLKLKWIKGLLQTSVIEDKGSLKSYITWEVFSRDEAVGKRLKMPTLSGHPPPLSPFRYSFCLEYFKNVYLFHEWTHLPTAFVICPLWTSSNKVFSTGPPAILRASNQHLKCIHMESISTQMYYFPFSAIILHLPKILPILSKKQEGLAMLAALNLCLQNTFKAKAKQTQLWWSV